MWQAIQAAYFAYRHRDEIKTFVEENNVVENVKSGVETVVEAIKENNISTNLQIVKEGVATYYDKLTETVSSTVQKTVDTYEKIRSYDFAQYYKLVDLHDLIAYLYICDKTVVTVALMLMIIICNIPFTPQIKINPMYRLIWIVCISCITWFLSFMLLDYIPVLFRGSITMICIVMILYTKIKEMIVYWIMKKKD